MDANIQNVSLAQGKEKNVLVRVWLKGAERVTSNGKAVAARWLGSNWRVTMEDCDNSV